MNNPESSRKGILKEIIPELPSILSRYTAYGAAIALCTWLLIKFIAC